MLEDTNGCRGEGNRYTPPVGVITILTEIVSGICFYLRM